MFFLYAPKILTYAFNLSCLVVCLLLFFNLFKKIFCKPIYVLEHCKPVYLKKKNYASNEALEEMLTCMTATPNATPPTI